MRCARVQGFKRARSRRALTTERENRSSRVCCTLEQAACKQAPDLPTHLSLHRHRMLACLSLYPSTLFCFPGEQTTQTFDSFLAQTLSLSSSASSSFQELHSCCDLATYLASYLRQPGTLSPLQATTTTTTIHSNQNSQNGRRRLRRRRCLLLRR